MKNIWKEHSTNEPILMITTMYSINEIKKFVKESARQRMFPCDQSDINQQILRDHEIGFEAVLTGNGNEKILLPEDGTVVYLFRGQNKEFVPCYPSLFRKDPKKLSVAEIFVWRMRLVLFRDMLNTYPIIPKFFKRHNFRIDYEGLAQHYGLKTSVIDLTSNIDIALFFATCKYNYDEDRYEPFTDGEIHKGILYVFCPMRANEPSPCKVSEYMNENITPIGLQPFLRPARQKGYDLHIKEGRSTKSWAYRFNFSNEDSKKYFEMFNGGRDLWIDDILATKTKQISDISSFSFKLFDRTFEEFRPKGYSKTKLKKELVKEGSILGRNGQIVSFSQEEINHAITRWNESEGEVFCNLIGRRPWFIQEDKMETISDDKCEYKVKVGTQNDYRTLTMLGENAMLMFIANPNGPEHSDWVNYMNTPNETHKYFTKEEGQWKHIPAKMVNLFAKRYLTKDDYLIV